MATPSSAYSAAVQTASLQEASVVTHQWLKFAALVLSILVLTILRRTGALAWPTLYFEDGAYFYQDQLLEPSRWILFRPFMAGIYALPIARVAAFLASWSPRLAPYIFNGIGLLVSAACCSVFALPRFRPALSSDLSRIVLCVLFAVSFDNIEMLTSATNAFWPVGLAVFLFAFVPPAALSRRRQALCLVAGIAAAYSTPLAPLAAPIALWGLWRNRSEGRWAFLTGLLIGAGIGAAIHLHFRSPAPVVSAGAVATALMVATAHRVVLSPIMGFLPAWHAATVNDLLPPLLAIVAFTALVVGLLVGGSKSARLRCLLALSVMAVTMALSLVNRGLVGGFQHVTGDVLYGGPRYFYLGCCSFAYLIALAGEEFLYGWRRLPTVLTCVVFFFGAYHNFKGQNGTYFPWNTYADQISTWQAKRDAWRDHSSVDISPVYVPINLEPWHIWLPGTSLLDAGFEDERMSPWTRFDVGDVAVSRTVHHSGSASKKLSGFAGIYEDLRFLNSGTRVRVSAYASTDQGGSAALWVTDSKEVQISDGPRALHDGQWQRFTVDFVTSATNKCGFTLHPRVEPFIGTR
jgi:hypothetical protein